MLVCLRMVEGRGGEGGRRVGLVEQVIALLVPAHPLEHCCLSGTGCGRFIYAQDLSCLVTVVGLTRTPVTCSLISEGAPPIWNEVI